MVCLCLEFDEECAVEESEEERRLRLVSISRARVKELSSEGKTFQGKVFEEEGEEEEVWDEEDDPGSEGRVKDDFRFLGPSKSTVKEKRKVKTTTIVFTMSVTMGGISISIRRETENK